MSGWHPINTLPELVRHYLDFGLRPEEAWTKALDSGLGHFATAEQYQTARALVEERLASWREIVAAYRATKKNRPTQLEVATGMGIAEDTLRVRLREWHGVRRWQDVHARILLEA